MLHARDRSLREEVYRAFMTRASSGNVDNTSIINEILKLRLEKAKLLGYKSHAQVFFFKMISDLRCILLSTRWYDSLIFEGQYGHENGNIRES